VSLSPGDTFRLAIPRGVGKVNALRLVSRTNAEPLVDMFVLSGRFSGTGLRPEDERRNGSLICLPLSAVEKGRVKT